MRYLCALLINSLIHCQDPGNQVWNFVEVPNSGCPVTVGPRFDPTTFSNCNLPAPNCPPLTKSASDNVTIQWDRIIPGHITILIAALNHEPTHALGACILPYPNVVRVTVPTTTTVSFTWNLPQVVDPVFIGNVGKMQLFQVDQVGQFTNSSNLVQIIL